MSYIMTNENGATVQHYNDITDFRGQVWMFCNVERGPEPGKSAIIRVRDEFGGHRRFYVEVFPGLTVTEKD